MPRVQQQQQQLQFVQLRIECVIQANLQPHIKLASADDLILPNYLVSPQKSSPLRP